MKNNDKHKNDNESGGCIDGSNKKATEALHQLAKNATIPWNPDISIKTWCQSAEKLYLQAGIDKKCQDLENSYVHYLKFLSLVLEYLPKHKEYSQYKKTFVSDLMRKATESMDTVENIKKTLLQKYMTTTSTPINTCQIKKIESIGDQKHDGDGDGTLVIDIQDVVKMIRKNPTSILFVDLRQRPSDHLHDVSGDDNNTETDMLTIKTEYIISIPCSKLSHGFNSNDLESLLSATKRAIFQRRETFDLLILFDDQSNHPSDNPAFDIVIQALYYMEFNKIPKRIPVILKGGWNSIKNSALPIEHYQPSSIHDVTDIVGSIPNDHTLNMRPYPKLQQMDQSDVVSFPKLDIFEKQTAPIVPPKPFASLPSSSSTVMTMTMMANASNSRDSGGTRPPIVICPKPFTQPSRDGHQLAITKPSAISVSPNPKDILEEVMKHQFNLVRQSALGASSSGISGLKNLGNTCFMNSIIQCCSSTLSLTRYFLSGMYRKHMNRRNKMGTGGILADAYYELLRSIWSGESSFYSPVQFKQAICRFANRFDSDEQQDSQEFMAFFLDGLHEDLNWSNQGTFVHEKNIDDGKLNDEELAELEWEKYLHKNFSVIVSLFQGQLRSTVSCSGDGNSCHYKSTTFNTFMYLSLPIHGTSLLSCMKMFLDEETLYGDNAWYCPRCKAHRRATKKLDLWRLPHVLIIHLKRFSYEGPFRDKLETNIDFPLYGLDMNWAVKHGHGYDGDGNTRMLENRESCIYDLFAVSNHYGGLTGGHYKATCFIEAYQKWYMFDDTRVLNMQPSQVKVSMLMKPIT